MPTVDALAHEFAEVARSVRQAGDQDLAKQLSDAIRQSVGPIPGEIRERLPEYLPNPYAAVLAGDMSIRISNRTGRTRPGVSIVAPERGSRTVERRRLIRLNRGVLAHPLFGNRGHWYEQPVKPLFFDEPIEQHAPQIRQDIDDALDRVKDQIYLGAHL